MNIFGSYVAGFVLAALADFLQPTHAVVLGPRTLAFILLTLLYGTMTYVFFFFLSKTFVVKTVIASWLLGLLMALIFVAMALAIFNKQYNIDSAIYFWVIFSGLIYNWFLYRQNTKTA